MLVSPVVGRARVLLWSRLTGMHGGEKSYNTCIIVRVELLVLDGRRGNVVRAWRAGLWAGWPRRRGPVAAGRGGGGGDCRIACVRHSSTDPGARRCYRACMTSNVSVFVGRGVFGRNGGVAVYSFVALGAPARTELKERRHTARLCLQQVPFVVGYAGTWAMTSGSYFRIIIHAVNALPGDTYQ